MCVFFSIRVRLNKNRFSFPRNAKLLRTHKNINKAKNMETGISQYKFRNYKLSILKSFDEVVSVVTFLIF